MLTKRILSGPLSTSLALCGFLALTGCDGACVGAGGIIDECKEDFTSDECADWDDIGVNGSTWTYHTGESCESLGYGIECSDGTWVADGSICGDF